jgi:hypothetical protein
VPFMACKRSGTGIGLSLPQVVKRSRAVSSSCTTSSRPAGRPCGDQSPPVRRQPGRGVVPTICVFTPYSGAHLTRLFRHVTLRSAEAKPWALVSLAVPSRLCVAGQIGARHSPQALAATS